MKKMYIFSFLMIFIFCGCSNNTLNISGLELSTIVIDSDHINATVEEGTIKSSKETITLVLENKTEYQYFYGVDFNLEVQIDNNWYKVPFDKNPEFIEIGLLLMGDSESQEKIELSKYFSDLPDGKYRIVKTFYLNDAKTVVGGLFNIKK